MSGCALHLSRVVDGVVSSDVIVLGVAGLTPDHSLAAGYAATHRAPDHSAQCIGQSLLVFIGVMSVIILFKL